MPIKPNNPLRSLIILLFLLFAGTSNTTLAQQPVRLTGQAALTYAQQQGLLALVNKDIAINSGPSSPAGREFFNFGQVSGLNQTSELYGNSVAIDGDVAVIGVANGTVAFDQARGKVYVYRRINGFWQQETILIASDGESLNYFGRSVAIENNTILVGAPEADIVFSTDKRGAVYVFTHNGVSWSQQQKLIASDGTADDFFGNAVAISGNTALIGSYRHSYPQKQGAAYIFVHNGSSWAETQILTASDGAQNASFGWALALAGDTAVITAPDKNEDGVARHGAAYLFNRVNDSWTETDKLLPDDGGLNFTFGSSVAIHQDLMAIGSGGVTVNGNVEQGAVYIFAHADNSWSQQTRLVADDGLPNSLFGNSVALTDQTVVIGAIRTPHNGLSSAGAAYVFIHTDDGWQQQNRLFPMGVQGTGQLGAAVAVDGDTALVGAPSSNFGGTDNRGVAFFFQRSDVPWFTHETLTAVDGTANAQFGNAVAIEGNTAVVGTRSATINDNFEQGAVYIYQRTAAGWQQKMKLTAVDSAMSDWFGQSVALSGDTLLVGAPRAAIDGQTQQGAVYVFTRSGHNWQQTAKLTAVDGLPGDHFGQDVAVEGDTAVIGAVWADIDADTDQGAAYIFTRTHNNWTQQAKLIVNTGAAQDRFGTSVAISGDTVVIGAPFANVNGHANQGAAYVFTRSGSTWSQQDKLFISPGVGNERFGIDVAVDGETAVIGAYLTTVNGSSLRGAGYIFTRAGSIWGLTSQLITGDGMEGDQLGVSVAITGETAVLGAWQADVNGHSDQGAAYTFTLRDGSWLPQHKFIAPDGTATSWFGYAVGSDAHQVIVGAIFANVDNNAHQGTAYIFDNGQLFVPDPTTIYLPIVTR
ncbi:MAG: FG-GAP repeat protein [Ardenticatenaceae bacterium]|nr:FG-GAP repeat protein [Ardenticatenaceae bacterium]